MSSFIKTLSLLIILVFSIPTSGICQMKVVFLDYDDKVIKDKKFQRLRDNTINIFGLEKQDDVHIYHLEYREHKSVLDSAINSNIRTELQNLLKKHIKPNDFLVINFYPGEDDCNNFKSFDGVRSSERYLAYLNTLKSIKRVNIQQFNLFHDEKGIERYSLNRKWYADPQGLFSRTFFKNHYPCSSFVIIRPDGKYISYLGEHAYSQIFAYIEELKSE